MAKRTPHRPAPRPKPGTPEFNPTRHSPPVLKTPKVVPPGMTWCEHCGRLAASAMFTRVESAPGERVCPGCAVLDKHWDGAAAEPPRRRETSGHALPTPGNVSPEDAARAEAARLALDAIPTTAAFGPDPLPPAPPEPAAVELPAVPPADPLPDVLAVDPLPDPTAPETPRVTHARVPPPPMTSRPCKKCNGRIVFAMNDKTGRVVPLDGRADVFVLFRTPGSSEQETACRSVSDMVRAGFVLSRLDAAGALEVVEPVGFHVSHFATCTNPEMFSRRKSGDRAE